MIKKRLRYIAIGGVFLAMAGCGISEGTVVAKEFEKGYYYTTFIRSGNVTVPVTNRKPDCWELTISNGDDKSDKCVDESYYNSVSVGDYVDLDGD